VARWIRLLINEGLAPVFSIIQVLNSFEEMSQSEIFWIKEYRKYFHLLNLTDGGEGTMGYKVSDSFRKKMSVLHKGKKMSAEWRRQASKRKSGVKLSPDHVMKIRAAFMRPEYRDKIGAIAKARMTPEVRMKISSTTKNRTFTPEHRANLREAMRRRMETPKWKDEVEELRKRRIASAA
jgi:hypothetical protein